jgi:NAD(P)H-flavin reductase/ferredoxin
MPKITFEGQEYLAKPGESILNCLSRHGVSVKYSCRSGVCQTCIMVANKGVPPEDAQAGLKDVLKAQNYFLACACVPKSDLGIGPPDSNLVEIETQVVEAELLNPEVIRLRLAQPENYDYFPGQYLTLYNSMGVGRSYSIASLPSIEDFLELHIRLMPRGQVSQWAHNGLIAGDSVRITESLGDCFYLPDNKEQPLLLIGTGTGLAPLYGITREALRQGHRGPIHLYHGGRALDGHTTSHGLYLVDELRELEKKYDQFFYHPSVSRGQVPEGMQQGRANELALGNHNNLTGWRIYLCGREDMVKATKQKTFLAGASLQDIYADPFLLTSPA